MPCRRSSATSTGELRYRLINRRYETWTGRPAEELLGRSVNEVMEPATLRSVESHLRRVLAGGTDRYEMELPLHDGTVRFLDIAHVPHVEDGNVRGFVSLVHDITERRQVEDALRESEAQYRASFQLSGVGRPRRTRARADSCV